MAGTEQDAHAFFLFIFSPGCVFSQSRQERQGSVGLRQAIKRCINNNRCRLVFHDLPLRASRLGEKSLHQQFPYLLCTKNLAGTLDLAVQHMRNGQQYFARSELREPGHHRWGTMAVKPGRLKKDAPLCEIMLVAPRADNYEKIIAATSTNRASGGLVIGFARADLIERAREAGATFDFVVETHVEPEAAPLAAGGTTFCSSRHRSPGIWSSPAASRGRPATLCFGGPDGRTVYVTEIEHRRLMPFRVDRPGLEWARVGRSTGGSRSQP